MANERMYVNKPRWVTAEDWLLLLRQYNGVPRCQQEGCGSLENLAVDHIHPRYLGGKDELSNYQFLCGYHNAVKGPRTAEHWRERFYFDLPMDVGPLRVMQFEAYQKVRKNEAFFGRPASQISRILLLLAAVVGSGKTLAIPSVAFAYNMLIRLLYGDSHPRADRVLVLTKERAIRDQLAESLSSELVRYGICGIAPRVSVVTKGDQFRNRTFIDKADICVSCVQQLWMDGGAPIHDLEAALALFPLIFVDEPHFGFKQVMMIVERAARSLCFGLTGSPVDARGRALKKFVMFMTYDYAQADKHDRSLKYLSSEPKKLAELVEVIGIEKADWRQGQLEEEIKDTNHLGYDESLVAAQTVCERVLQEVYERDRDVDCGAFFGRLAEHRPESAVADIVYPVHALIKVDSKAMGMQLCREMNAKCEARPDLYPRAEGYHFEVVMTEGETPAGEKTPPLPLPPDHPWLLAQRTGGKLRIEEDGKERLSSRFIIQIGIGREGVHNAYCGVVGLACKTESVVEVVQRVIGRQLRATVAVVDGVLHVPILQLDRVKIITHVAFKNSGTIKNAVEFVLNMSDKLRDIPTLEDWMAGEEDQAPGDGIDTITPLTRQDRIEIAATVGEFQAQGSPIPVDILADHFGGVEAEKRTRVSEFIDKIIKEPEAVKRDLKIHPRLGVEAVVMREVPKAEPKREDLINFILRHHPENQAMIALLDNPDVYHFFTTTYLKYRMLSHAEPARSLTKLSDIRKGLALEVLRCLGAHLEGPEGRVYKLAGRAMKYVIGCGEEGQLLDDCIWDVPQYHVCLLRPEVRNRMTGWMIGRLAAAGYCPALQVSLGVEPEAEDE